MIGHRFIYISEITGCKTEGIIAFEGRYISFAKNPFSILVKMERGEEHVTNNGFPIR